jgi:hypothetical protein
VKISLIRFLGAARFHTARLPDVADNPRHPSPSALQHALSRLSHVHRVPPGPIPSLSRSWAGAADTPPSSDQTLATSSSGRPGDSANTATRASPCGTPDPGTGCYTGCRHTGSTLAALHTGTRTVPGGRVDRERGHCCLFSRSPSEPDGILSHHPALQFPGLRRYRLSASRIPVPPTAREACCPSPWGFYPPVDGFPVLRLLRQLRDPRALTP